MLLVTVELVPGGYTPARRTIASLRISNISELAEVSDYLVEAMEARNPLTQHPSGNADCVVTAHPRAQRVWTLLERACREIMTAEFDEL